MPARHMIRTDDLDYSLPERLIATRPAEPRDSARLMVVHRSHERVEHRTVRDLPGYLDRDDVLVLNATGVAPARIVARRAQGQRRIHGLFLRELSNGRWLLLLRSRGRLRIGDRLELAAPDDRPSGFSLTLASRDGERWVADLSPGSISAAEVLDRVGLTPLPPYILKARGEAPWDDAQDRRWYQTVFADVASRRSVAAPTAGLHLTPALLDALAIKGVRQARIMLHVGPGTFKPVSADRLDQHHMDAEPYEVPAQAAALLHEMDRIRAVEPNPSRRPRLVAVGTTVVRTVESLAADLSELVAAGRGISGSTDLMIAPPFQFRRVDGLLTNFHLPRSTLMALVAAVIGLDRLKAIYSQGIAADYRFYSYGDAMLILP